MVKSTKSYVEFKEWQNESNGGFCIAQYQPVFFMPLDFGVPGLI
jgi:hypothetical protein